MPVIAATDIHTDIGSIAEKNGYGYWCESINPDDFTACVSRFVEHPDRIISMGEKGYQFLLDNYLIKYTYQTILKHIC